MMCDKHAAGKRGLECQIRQDEFHPKYCSAFLQGECVREKCVFPHVKITSCSAKTETIRVKNTKWTQCVKRRVARKPTKKARIVVSKVQHKTTPSCTEFEYYLIDGKVVKCCALWMRNKCTVICEYSMHPRFCTKAVKNKCRYGRRCKYPHKKVEAITEGYAKRLVEERAFCSDNQVSIEEEEEVETEHVESEWKEQKSRKNKRKRPVQKTKTITLTNVVSGQNVLVCFEWWNTSRVFKSTQSSCSCSYRRDKYHPSLCHTFAQRGYCTRRCLKNGVCKFVKLQNPDEPILKAKLCRTFFTKSVCKYGSKCNYAHSLEEQVVPQIIDEVDLMLKNKTLPFEALKQELCRNIKTHEDYIMANEDGIEQVIPVEKDFEGMLIFWKKWYEKTIDSVENVFELPTYTRLALELVRRTNMCFKSIRVLDKNCEFGRSCKFGMHITDSSRNLPILSFERLMNCSEQSASNDITVSFDISLEKGVEKRTFYKKCIVKDFGFTPFVENTESMVVENAELHDLERSEKQKNILKHYEHQNRELLLLWRRRNFKKHMRQTKVVKHVVVAVNWNLYEPWVRELFEGQKKYEDANKFIEWFVQKRHEYSVMGESTQYYSHGEIIEVVSFHHSTEKDYYLDFEGWLKGICVDEDERVCGKGKLRKFFPKKFEQFIDTKGWKNNTFMEWLQKDFIGKLELKCGVYFPKETHQEKFLHTLKEAENRMTGVELSITQQDKSVSDDGFTMVKTRKQKRVKIHHIFQKEFDTVFGEVVNQFNIVREVVNDVLNQVLDTIVDDDCFEEKDCNVIEDEKDDKDVCGQQRKSDVLITMETQLSDLMIEFQEVNGKIMSNQRKLNVVRRKIEKEITNTKKSLKKKLAKKRKKGTKERKSIPKKSRIRETLKQKEDRKKGEKKELNKQLALKIKELNKPIKELEKIGRKMKKMSAELKREIDELKTEIQYIS